MSTLRTALRIVRGHWLYVLIYLIIMSALGLLAGLSASGASSAELSEATATVAVIDRDGSEVSQGLTAYLERVGEPIELEDSRRAVQDATAGGRVDYIVIIPEGYEDALVRAAEAGEEPPLLETVVSSASAAGALMDVRTGTFLGQVSHYLRLLTDDPAEAVARAEASMTAKGTVEVLTPAAAPLPAAFLAFVNLSTYPLLAYAVVVIAVLMASLRERQVLARTTAAPTSSRSRSLGLLAACALLGLLGWVWVMGIGLVVFTPEDLTGSAVRVAVVALAMLAYVAVAVAIGFLVGQAGLGENAANAIGNIGGMGMSFLAGAWVPLTLLPDGLVAVARLTPAYWAHEAISGAATVESPSWDRIVPLLVDCGLCLLFAVALVVVAMVVGRTRSRAAL